MGGTKNPDIAAIRRLAPDLVLLNAEENRREDFAELEAAGLRLWVTHPRRCDDVAPMLRALGRLLGGEAAAERHAARVDDLCATAIAGRLPRVFCPIWKNPWMGFNRDTYAHDVLRRAGGANVLAQHRVRFPQVRLEEVADHAPEVVLLPDEPYVFRERDVADLEALAETPALRAGRVVFCDGKDLTWFGTRTARAIPRLVRTISASEAPPRRSPPP